MRDDDIVEGRATARFVSALVGSKNRGDAIRTTVAHARHLVAIGAMQITDKRLVGPSEIKPAGPAETKAEVPAKKFLGAPTDGRSIGSPSSSAPGAGIRSSSLGVGLVSYLATASSESKPRMIATAVRSPLLR